MTLAHGDDVIDSTRKERDAALAALRLLQTALGNRLVLPNDGEIGSIFTDDGQHDGLSIAEIDELCERINFGDVKLIDIRQIDAELLTQELRRRGFGVSVWGPEDIDPILNNDETQTLDDDKFQQLSSAFLMRAMPGLEEVLGARGNAHLEEVWHENRNELLSEIASSSQPKI